MLWLERLRRWGRCLVVVVGMSGDEGSFLTTILGGCGPRDLREDGRLEAMSDMMSL